ncbi:MAG: type 4a pilus biogenesis protein PilO [Planctomycetes bacterium]|nr:type 4a pilus biogenesis protein PilO [Planctomycetota bacterium]
MRLTEKQLFFGTIGLFVVVALVLGFYGYQLYAGEAGWRDTQDEAQRVRVEIEALKQKAEELNQLRFELNKLREAEEQFKRILPDPKAVRFTEFVDTLEKFAKNAQVRLPNVVRNPSSQVTPGPGGSAASAFNQISYTLTVEGGFYEVARFIFFIETHERFIKVESISFTPKQRTELKEKDKELRSLVTATIVVSTYTF